MGSFSLHGSILWHTPDNYLEAVRQVMGGIDLDPASDDVAQARIQAGKHYTGDPLDGLAEPWEGRVFLNPPHRRPLMDQFYCKAAEEIQTGRISEIIILGHTQEVWEAWFQTMLSFADAVCFIAELIKWTPGHTIPAMFRNLVTAEHDIKGSFIAYTGRNLHQFAKVFKPFGRILYG